MRTDYLPDDLKRLWKELASNPVEVSPDELRREARKLRGGVRLRNSFVVVVCGLIIAAYCFFALRAPTTLERIGCVLAIVGAGNMIVQFPEAAGTEDARRRCDRVASLFIAGN